MQLNRTDFQRLADLRISEAKVLLDNACYEGAYYIAGYSVECALKACIAKQTKQHEFPPRQTRDMYTHELSTLVRAAGLTPQFDTESDTSKDFEVNWRVVSDWSEEKRYETSIREVDARNLYDAIVDSRNGVLTWLKTLW